MGLCPAVTLGVTSRSSSMLLMSFLKARFLAWWRTRRARRISLDDARTRVERGADYLDEVDPAWYRRVDPDTLELASGSSCVLGQLHGDFRMGLSRSHLIDLSSAPRASLSPVSYGFQCVSGVDEADQDRDYAFLNQAWQEAVRKRQAADPTIDPKDGAGAPSRTSGPDADDRQAHRPARSDGPAPSSTVAV